MTGIWNRLDQSIGYNDWILGESLVKLKTPSVQDVIQANASRECLRCEPASQSEMEIYTTGIVISIVYHINLGRI